MVTEKPQNQRSTIDFSWFNAKIHASGPITRQIVVVTGLFAVILSGMWLVQTRVVQKLDAVGANVSSLRADLTDLRTKLVQKRIIVAQVAVPAKKLTAVAMLSKVEHP